MCFSYTYVNTALGFHGQTPRITIYRIFAQVKSHGLEITTVEP